MGPGAKVPLGGGFKGAVGVCQITISVATEAMLLSVAWLEDVQRGRAESHKNPLYLKRNLFDFQRRIPHDRKISH